MKLSPRLNDLISKGEVFAFLFDFELPSGQKMHYTNHTEQLSVASRTYVPYCSLEIGKAYFNDSAHDFIELHGIMESGIETFLDQLNNAQVNIGIVVLKNGFAEPVLQMRCVAVSYDNMRFSIRLENNVVKLGCSLTSCYSKTCRAMLGDHRCKVLLENHSMTVAVKSISANLVTVDVDLEMGYYDFGRLQFLGGQSSLLIVKHRHDGMLLEKEVPLQFREAKQVKLFPGCDKKLSTCKNKFNNVVNFQGEPFIPEFNY